MDCEKVKIGNFERGCSQSNHRKVTGFGLSQGGKKPIMTFVSRVNILEKQKNATFFLKYTLPPQLLFLLELLCYRVATEKGEWKMDFLEQLKQHINEHDTFGKSSRVKLLAIKPGYAEAVMEITENSCNAVGTVQGGAIFTLADMAFAGAANSCGDKCVAMNAAASFIRPGSGRFLRAEAREVSRGRRSCVIDVEVRNEEDKLVAKIQFTGFFFEK